MPGLVPGTHAVVSSMMDAKYSTVWQLHGVGARNMCGHDGEAVALCL
jgi:hypothetical protein